MKQEVGDKFYFCEQIPYTVMRALFGAKLQKFSDGERMDNNGNSGAVKSFHNYFVAKICSAHKFGPTMKLKSNTICAHMVCLNGLTHVNKLHFLGGERIEEIG